MAADALRPRVPEAAQAASGPDDPGDSVRLWERQPARRGQHRGRWRETCGRCRHRFRRAPGPTGRRARTADRLRWRRRHRSRRHAGRARSRRHRRRRSSGQSAPLRDIDQVPQAPHVRRTWPWSRRSTRKCASWSATRWRATSTSTVWHRVRSSSAARRTVAERGTVPSRTSGMGGCPWRSSGPSRRTPAIPCSSSAVDGGWRTSTTPCSVSRLLARALSKSRFQPKTLPGSPPVIVRRSWRSRRQRHVAELPVSDNRRNRWRAVYRAEPETPSAISPQDDVEL